MASPDDTLPLWLGLICVAAGLVIVGVAADVISVDPSTIHTPRWVLGACGAVFALCGVAAVAPKGSAVGSAAAGTVVLAFGLIDGWVAVFGDAAQFSGGLPFVPDGVNVAVARGLFGFGAVLCLALFVWGASRIVRGEPHVDPR